MKRKNIFFDADGTILDIEKGVPADTAGALFQLKQNGHRIFLCTGRGRSYITSGVEKIGFDGMITNLGAYMEYHGKELFRREIDPETARKTVEILRANRFVPVLEGVEYTYYDPEEYTTEIDWFADLITRDLENRHRPIRGNEDNLHFNKISAKKTPGCTPEQLCRMLSPWYDYIIHKGGIAARTIEFVAKGCSKGLSLCVLCGVLGIEKQDTISFGDSNNDLPMFRVTGTRVAMGDGTDALKAEADLVTDPLWEGGVPNALKKLGLI